MEEPIKSETNRQPNGTFGPGNNANPVGRPVGKTLKEYARDYYMLKTDEDKRAYIDWLEEKKPGFAWTMAEGNPHQSSDTDVKGVLTIEFDSSFKKDETEKPV